VHNGANGIATCKKESYVPTTDYGIYPTEVNLINKAVI
jgi:hypothetical protein